MSERSSEELGQDAREAWAAYRRLHLLVDAEVARDLERGSGLSMPDYEVLAALLAISDEKACIRVTRLATRLRWPHSRLSRHLGRMERRGLIAREPCELDGRGDDVLLTEAGREAHDRATPGHLASIERHFAGALTAGQLAALTDIERTISRRT